MYPTETYPKSLLVGRWLIKTHRLDGQLDNKSIRVKRHDLFTI